MATKKAPRVERECLACGTTFEGTPKAVRCGPCKVGGRKVPADKQAARAKRRRCSECQRTRPVEEFTGHTHICATCVEVLDLPPATLIDEAREIERLKKAKIKSRLAAQTEYLDRRARKPKGMKRMTKNVTHLPIAIVWRQLVAADGAAHAIRYLGEAHPDLSSEDAYRLLIAFHRLRQAGHHPDSLAQIDPRPLLKDASQVEPEADDFPPMTEMQIKLGLPPIKPTANKE